MNNAELIVKTLRAAGVSHGFGIPSGNVLPLLEAMRVGRLPYVLTAHEGSAAFAADVMGRMTGAPGLCIATLIGVTSQFSRIEGRCRAGACPPPVGREPIPAGDKPPPYGSQPVLVSENWLTP